VSDEPETSPVQSASTAVQTTLQSAPATLQNSGAQVAAQVDERPELAVGGAFAGGLLLALILKRIAA
jgi:hypothetical protein